ncbi:MAG: PqqD family protein [bacterium]|nr:PqqD family protein [bacterium]
MDSTSAFRINSPTIISEMVDGEVIAINLDSGTYYSLQGTAGIIWNLIEKGATVPQIIEWMSQDFTGSPEFITTAIHRLLNELRQETLIVSHENPVPQAHLQQSTISERPPFAEPFLEKFTDMSDLLLLDPIHDVNESGWPLAKGS